MDKKPDPQDRPRVRRAVMAGDEVLSELEIRTRGETAAARDHVADERDRIADLRDRSADERDRAANARDRDAAVRERMLADREARPREQPLDSTREATDREQLRQANEHLVIASVRAQTMADAANAARATAADNEERFRSLVAASAGVVWQADADGTVHIHWDNWKAFTPVDIDTADPRWGWLLAVHPLDRELVRDTWQRALATSTPYVCQHRLQPRDSGELWVESRAVPIVKSGIVREWIGMMSDVTDRVRIEEAREQFIAILGHDLRNPLHAILMGLELLATLPAPYADLVAKITRSGHRMEAMIRDVLDFTRGRLGGGIPVTPTDCDLGRICGEVVAEMKQVHPGRDIGLEIAGDLRGECDTARIEQMLSNLLGNALGHGADPIRVRVHDDGDDIVLSVQNQGPPIPAALLPRLFDPFSQGPAESRTSSQGLGLGLYIVSEIVRAHHGAVTVASEPGDGTTFVVRFPRRRGASADRPRDQNL